MDNLHFMEQRSKEWFEIRVGKVTASNVSALVNKTKAGKWGTGAITYQAQLVTELLTGQYNDFVSPAMEWGMYTEPQAQAAYSFFVSNEPIKPIGFADHPTIKGAGASPDGLVGSNGGVEIKCPNTVNHMKTLLADTVPKEHIVQMQWQMACTGRQWCDFVSFDPRMGSGLDLFVKRVERDNEHIAKLEELVTDFVAETNVIVDRLLSIRNQEAA